ncbi:TetR/AcrR family transcriptional regulator [Actinomadura sp. NTSP31]|uniref:TetR/AcrR family transcriptional regulator n=1 Tax=Actinomadura sp. NTSP31 TaxID=1735447 RepID=UPI0035C02BA9
MESAGVSLGGARRPGRDDGTHAGDAAHAGSPASFRGRLLAGLADSIRERGFRETTVSDIVRHARTSRRTFYAEFPTKDACFVELLQVTNRILRRRVTEAIDPAAPWETQIRQGVQAYVEMVASEPEITLSWIRELQALGAGTARRMQREAVDALFRLLQDVTGNAGMLRAGTRPVGRPFALLLIGGLRELTATLVEDGADVGDITEVAVEATIALFRPVPENGPAPMPGGARPPRYDDGIADPRN